MVDKNKTTPPKVGEETGKQASSAASIGGVAIFGSQFDFAAPPPSNYTTFRKMRANPTIALARSVATSPIRASSISIEADEGVPQDIKDFIDAQTKGFWPGFLRNVLNALDYGWQPFEKVWGVENGRFVYKKLKPLIVDNTEPMLEEKTGNLVGLKQYDVHIPIEKTYIFTNEQELDNYYGRSRHENCRATSWNHWEQTMERFGKYLGKVAGITPMMKYPPGKTKDASGAEKENFDIATACLASLGRGNGIVFPDTMPSWIGDNIDHMLRAGVDMSKFQAWAISFLETGTDHSGGFSASLRYLDSLMMRGWLVPERVATEGQMGTKAESATQTDTAMSISDILFDDIIRSVNWYLINPLLVYNFGPEYENKVRIKKGGLVPELQAFYRTVMAQVLGNPVNLGFMLQWTKMDEMFERLGWPVKEDADFDERPPGPEDDDPANPQLANRVSAMMASMIKPQK